VTEGEPEPFVPHVSVMVALVLTLVSLGWLIYFIHHVADSIQADTVIAEVYAELDDALDRLYPEVAAHEPAISRAMPVAADLLAQAPGTIAASKGATFRRSIATPSCASRVRTTW
jgi:uncharacterized membrane protein